MKPVAGTGSTFLACSARQQASTGSTWQRTEALPAATRATIVGIVAMVKAAVVEG